ncbi:MAG TPA: PH domain-containing protein [Pseudolabrys sp.]|nr:PH domain-containing protein [Pseudolabrys sp.]
MSYVKSVLQPNEQLLKVGRLHWIAYDRAIFFLLVGLVLLWLENTYWKHDVIMVATAVIFGAMFLASFLHAWFIRWTTEFAVTDRRVIYKRGFINRHTAEMHMDKVESVDVDQSVLGRILGYGTIHVLGTGQGIEHLHRIADPIGLRNAITAK